MTLSIPPSERPNRRVALDLVVGTVGLAIGIAGCFAQDIGFFLLVA